MQGGFRLRQSADPDDQHLKQDIRRLVEDLQDILRSTRHKEAEAQTKVLRRCKKGVWVVAKVLTVEQAIGVCWTCGFLAVGGYWWLRVAIWAAHG